MAKTPHIGLTLVEQAQAQKEVTLNQALRRIDALLNTAALSASLGVPPASPQAGDVYIVAADASGAWAGKETQVAFFEQVWRFITPRAGLSLWVADSGSTLLFNGTAWVPGAAGIVGAPEITPVFETDLMPIVRGGVVYMASIAEVLAAIMPPGGGAGSLIFSTAGNSGLAAGVI